MREPSASAAGDRVFDAFQRAFGTDLDRLEDEWHKFMKTVQTPLGTARGTWRNRLKTEAVIGGRAKD